MLIFARSTIGTSVRQHGGPLWDGRPYLMPPPSIRCLSSSGRAHSARVRAFPDPPARRRALPINDRHLIGMKAISPCRQTSGRFYQTPVEGVPVFPKERPVAVHFAPPTRPWKRQSGLTARHTSSCTYLESWTRMNRDPLSRKWASILQDSFVGPILTWTSPLQKKSLSR